LSAVEHMTNEATDKAGKPERKPKSRRVGQVLERGENRWLIRVFIGYKSNVSNDYFNKTIHGTKKLAEAWLRAALVRKDKGEPLEDPDVTFAVLFEEWLISKKRKAKTLQIYRENFDDYIKPTSGKMPILNWLLARNGAGLTMGSVKARPS
jgi:hypothetical protein